LKKEDFYINNLKTIEKNTFKKFLFLKIQENYLFNLKIKVDFNLYLKNKSIYDNLFILFDLHELDFYNYLILLKNNLIKEGGLNFNYKNSFILNEKIIPKKILSFLKNSIKKTQNLNNSIILNSRSNFKKRRTYVSENNFNYFLTLKYSDIYLKNIFFLKNFLKNSLENLENLKKNYLFYKKKNYFINKCSFHNNLKKKFNLNFFNISELFIYRQKNSKIDNLLNFNNNLEPYIENSEIRDNFLSINFLLSNSIQNSQKIFYFCDINIFFNIKFFFNYLNEYFLLKILFFKNNN
jgi:hypothetical protein